VHGTVTDARRSITAYEQQCRDDIIPRLTADLALAVDYARDTSTSIVLAVCRPTVIDLGLVVAGWRRPGIVARIRC